MSSRPALGSTQPPFQWVPEALSPGLKRQGREADHSPPTSAEVKKIWIYTSTVHTSSWRIHFHHHHHHHYHHHHHHQWLYSRLLGPGLFFSFVIFFVQTIGLLGGVISLSQGRNNRTSIARQLISKHASLTVGAMFSAWPVQSAYKEVFSSIK
jgi:hypothetical protein